jgi:hypothetical protein
MHECELVVRLIDCIAMVFPCVRFVSVCSFIKFVFVGFCK